MMPTLTNLVEAAWDIAAIALAVAVTALVVAGCLAFLMTIYDSVRHR